MPLPTPEINRLIDGIFEGTISPFNLPSFLYAYTVYELDGSFFAGFGEIPRGDIPTIDRAVNFRANIGKFSGAKTFQEVKELTDFVFDENGRKRPFSQFREKAQNINEKYNTRYLEVERDSVFTQSQNARRWQKIEAEADIFPRLQYVTVGDDRVRPDHAALDGLTLNVNDPLWRDIMPQNGWRCRCTVIQLEAGRVATRSEKTDQTRLIRDEFRKNPEFKYNPGMTEYIFKETGKGKHDYFKVPRNFEDELKRNFGFPGVDEITGRFI